MEELRGSSSQSGIWLGEKRRFLMLGALVLLLAGFSWKVMVGDDEVGDEAESEIVRPPRPERDVGDEVVRYRRSLPEEVWMVTREVVGDEWKKVLEKVPARYEGGQEATVDLWGGGSEVRSVIEREEIFFAADLVAANHGWDDGRRLDFLSWLQDWRARLIEREIVKNATKFEHEGKMMSLIGAGHLYQVLRPEKWLQEAEAEYIIEYDIEDGQDWGQEDRERGRIWQEALGIRTSQTQVRLGLTSEQWRQLEGRQLGEAVVFLREDQLFRLYWMSGQSLSFE